MVVELRMNGSTELYRMPLAGGVADGRLFRVRMAGTVIPFLTSAEKTRKSVFEHNAK